MTIRPGQEMVRLHCEQLEDRVTPTGSTWDQQSFDTLTSGAIPSNWKQWSSSGTSLFGAGEQRSFLGGKGLISSGTSAQSARAWNGDVLPADFSVSGYVYLDSLQPVQILVRGQNLGGPTPSFYALSITRGLKAQLVKVVNGVSTGLGSIQSPDYFSAKWARVTFKPVGNQLAVEIYRPDVAQYLNAAGHWQSAAADAIQVNDSAISGDGYIGVNRPAGYSGNVSLDEFQITGPPGRENFDATPAGQLPPSWAGWSNSPAAGFGAFNGLSQSASQSLQSASSSSAAAARAWLNAALPANVQATTSVYLNSLLPLRLFARGSGMTSATPTYYALSITRGLEVKVLRVINGVATELGSLKSSAYLSNQWVRVTLVTTGTRVQAIVYRSDTGQYLDANGNWKTGLARAIDVQDGSIGGSGFAGVERPPNYAGTLTVDDFDVASAGGDSTPPNVSIGSPAAGGALAGRVTIRASASDSGGVEHLEFLVDGVVRFSTSLAPYQWTLDTTGLTNGIHTIAVRAYDTAGNVGVASVTCTVGNDTLPRPIIPRHYNHIRIASLAYAGTPMGQFEKDLLKNSIDLVIPHPQYLPQINAVAPNTPQLIYSNISNLYEQLLTDWSNYADAHHIDRELAYYHVSQATPWTGDSASSKPVSWFWAVSRGSDPGALTSYTAAAHDSATGDVPFGSLGQSVYLGYLEKFREINVNLFLGATSGWKGALEYASAIDPAGKPAAWKTLTTLSDTTLNFAKSGTISFDPPADWVAAALGGSAPLYYVRIRTTASGNIPVATTILGRNYATATTTTSPHGIIPAFDLAADVNHDGYLNDAEYARRMAGKDARFVYESRLFYPYYGQMRYITNPSTVEVQKWAADYHVRFLQANPLADGLFMDNSGGHSPVSNTATVESTAAYSDDFGALLAGISRAIAPRWIAANTSGGGADADPVIRSTAASIEEFGLRPLAHNRQQFEDLAALIARRRALKSPPAYIVLDSLPTGGSPTDPRTQIATLAYYYMLADSENTFLMFYGGFDPNSAWSQHWSAAAAFDVGQPKGDFSVFASGADPANAKLTYNVYQRDYGNALVLYKPLSYKSGAGTGGLSNATATTHHLDGTYRVLSALGTLGQAVTSITLRNGEGAILIKA